MDVGYLARLSCTMSIESKRWNEKVKETNGGLEQKDLFDADPRSDKLGALDLYEEKCVTLA